MTAASTGREFEDELKTWHQEYDDKIIQFPRKFIRLTDNYPPLEHPFLGSWSALPGFHGTTMNFGSFCVLPNVYLSEQVCRERSMMQSRSFSKISTDIVEVIEFIYSIEHEISSLTSEAEEGLQNIANITCPPAKFLQIYSAVVELFSLALRFKQKLDTYLVSLLRGESGLFQGQGNCSGFRFLTLYPPFRWLWICELTGH